MLGKLKKILPADCIEKKVSMFINLSDDDSDQKLLKNQETEKEFNSTSCLISAIKVRPQLFDHRMSLSKRSESIKNKLWNEVYVDLQGG